MEQSGGDEWQWSWEDPGEERHLGRVFHKAVKAYRPYDGVKRIYRLGDTVVMKGENEDTWIAQIVELFQVKEDDEELREVLQIDLRKINSTHHYELIRVTLRWFYNPSDMNMHTLRSSSCPNHIKNEIYFSDHVEKEGYNDITVIEGRAWLARDKREREDILQNPPKGFLRGMDQVRIVRCFVNSQSPELAVRELDTGELRYLLGHPTADKDLFETSRQRMRGLVNSNGTVLQPPSKGTGVKQSRRRRRTIREPIDVEDDEFDPHDRSARADKPEPKIDGNLSSAKSSVKRKERRSFRKKHVAKEDNDGVTALPESDSVRMQSLKQANEEVLDMVASLNQSALPGDGIVGSVPGAGGEDDDDDDVVPIDLDAPVPSSGAPHSLPPNTSSALVTTVAKQPVIAPETILLDGNDTADEQKRRRMQSSQKRGQEANGPSGTSSELDKPGSSFMRTARYRNNIPESKMQEPMAARGGVGNVERPNPGKNSVSGEIAERIDVGKPSRKDRRNEQSHSKQDKVVRRDARLMTGKESTLQPKSSSHAKARGGLLEQKTAKRTKTGETMTGQKDPKKIKVSDDVAARRDAKKLEGREGKAKRKELATKVANSAQKTVRNEKEIDWWEETQKVLKKLEAEFRSMSTTLQEVFSSNVDIVFDLAVAKVTERGLFGNVDPKNEQLTAIAREILDELSSISEEAGEEGHGVTEMQGGGSVVLDVVD